VVTSGSGLTVADRKAGDTDTHAARVLHLPGRLPQSSSMRAKLWPFDRGNVRAIRDENQSVAIQIADTLSAKVLTRSANGLAETPTKTLCLAGDSPISRRKSDAPKVRCRPMELDPNLFRTSQLRLGEYDTAFLLFPTECVLQNEPLVTRYVGCQADQCAMSIDHQGVRPFIKGWTLFWQSVSDNWNAQHEPLATSPPRPGFWLTQSPLKH
jgi:hypothetical protein